MIVTASVDVLKFSSLVVMPLGVFSIEKKALDLVGGVERKTFLLVEMVRVALQDAANVAGVRTAILVDDMAEDQHLAGPKNIGRPPVESAPIHGQSQIALALRREPAD